MADAKITALLPISEADVQAAADVLPLADVSTSETKKVTVGAAVGAAVRVMAPGSLQGTLIATGTIGTTQLADGAVTNVKVAAGIDGSKLAADSVTAREIAVNAVTASELADGAVDTAALADGAVTDAKVGSGISGSKLLAGSVTGTQLAANSVGAAQLADGAVDTAAVQDGAITSNKVANAGIGTTQLADSAVVTAKVADAAITGPKLAAGAVDDSKISGVTPSKLGVAAAGAVLVGPATGASAAPSFRALQGSDLPAATASTNGAVKPAAGGGLSVAADGALSIGATTSAGTGAVVTYNTFGQVTSSRTLVGTDLPLATSTAVGGVKAGAGLTVNAAGSLAISNSVTAGTGTKVTFNAQGLITGTAALAAADIPGLDASKIVSGTLPGVHIADRSITQQKLSDYAISYIQEAAPTSIPGDHPVGELWFQESSARLSMWNGNSWMAVGQGSLSNENLRFCGTFNATTGVVTAVTQFGTTAGLAPAAAIPAAVNTLTGVYLVCDTAGTFSGKTYDPGDWVLCMGQARGWERIDTLSGGGGGGASALDALTDVTITTPSNGDVLRYNGTRWVNSMANLDPGSY